MFNFSVLLLGSLLAGQHDAQKERSPPSQPTPVTFPSLRPPKPSVAGPPSLWSEGIPSHLLKLKKPSDVNLNTLAVLNISFEPECDFETLLSSISREAQSYLPPRTWLDPPTQSEPQTTSTVEPAIQLLNNGRRAPDQNDFYVRAKELHFKNEDAFASLSRKGGASRAPVRLAQFRKFWENLDNMAYYWDNSLDEYIPPRPQTVKDSGDKISNGEDQDTNTENQPSDMLELEGGPVSPNVDEPRKKAKTEAVSNETVTSPINPLALASNTVASQPSSISSSRALPARSAPPKVPWAVSIDASSQKPEDLTKGSYRGYRIGNGAEMPDQYRIDCVRAFVEPIAWVFGVNLTAHRRPPVLLLEHVRFPVRMNTVAWRGPTDRVKARQGWLEGPILGIQCRPDTNFGSNGDLEAESVLDIVRELGGMLLLAQERAREGKTEPRAGDGKWWTHKPRWGGGPGGEVGETTGTNDAAFDKTAQKAEEKPANRPRLGSRDRRRPSPSEIWKILRIGNPLWDPKIVYEAIGKDREDAWDTIFLISSLHHHISILKLRVHPLYVQHLTQGTLPEGQHADQSWCSPSLQRTRWFDLFNVEDRKEAMRGIWGILAYMMRSQEKEKDKHDVSMKDAET
ncbi:hypothetical protein BDV95DRAFT_10095 [Massariosphaeria phaeospora]|uniref:Uncharacterized protein n=1 Tax=Massariosphaeria phaeospora TaxID=100035 RepID=A0A7C8IJJ5_9PLEO|nr:hypothetical protein BDV95DRAFT_10095 [Massariosphaeria phaeospora]